MQLVVQIITTVNYIYQSQCNRNLRRVTLQPAQDDKAPQPIYETNSNVFLSQLNGFTKITLSSSAEGP